MKNNHDFVLLSKPLREESVKIIDYNTDYNHPIYTSTNDFV